MNSLNIYLDHFAFGKQPIFVKQKISVTKGNIVGIIGENGIGKSTFVNLLAGNITSTLQINYHNKSLVPGYNPFVFFQPDDFTGLEYLTTLEVTQYFLLLYGEEFDQEKFDLLVQVANIQKEKVLKEYIKNLSKGTRQKVVFIIYMMANRDIIIFDEGLENIDVDSLASILAYLKKWVKIENRLCLIATHSTTILEYADQFLHLVREKDGTTMITPLPSG
ncbi:ATP-binding transport protein NatA [Paenibacillus larvae subsp. larvae]|uniref:ATP-binding transport protein NatA n=2 Tax=Paenibacillus larvae TaxID=1464 RepID=A0A2L1UA44_9BACL|nr:ATP-binding cassette domain-containing protein [Paenibacillus larvae]AQT85632.1 hypothetical protein B1222_16470 [Paenibacillus larvae subsp. pulvifaciens]AQZ47646.1 hypothetical protein B5S25_14750 [Paenibacillus larvae subsp. pulvifaciens]AVF25027.1 ATP-binding transport protein NatA [Paenibacillus larvae subsp. larvae]AVF29791.1 ATP-binding transport protein NatA [Paenibacillus larvae subsp. larvae]MBH0343608.1 hypothetical protein [Paenibacillus larvae]